MKPELLVFRFEMPSKSMTIQLLAGGIKDIRIEVRLGNELVAMISEEVDSGYIGMHDFCKRMELLFGILQSAIVMNPERDWNAENLQNLVEASKQKVIERAELLMV